VYGYGGRTPAEKASFWYGVLMRPPMATLLHYARGAYRGFDVSESAIREFYRLLSLRGADIAALQGSLKDRPAAGVRRRAERKEASGLEKWGSVFGREVHVDEVGGYTPIAFGWMRVQFIAVDMGYSPPYVFLDSRRVKVAPQRMMAVESGSGTVGSLQRLIEHYRMHGHHLDQWNVPIVSLRSDPGSSFRSVEFEEVLDRERVHHKLGVSGAHYQNGGAERQIQTMVAKVTAAYAEARHVPRELHPYCIQLYVDVSRTWTVEEGKPPVGEAFTGKRVDFVNRPLFKWGQPLLVFIPKPHRDWKFGVKAFMAMYVGLPPQAVKEGILVYNPATRHVVLTRVYRVVDELPDDWDVVTGPLPGFLSGGAESKEELEAYLALQDPDQLPFIRADEEEGKEEFVTVSIEEDFHRAPLLKEVLPRSRAPVESKPMILPRQRVGVPVPLARPQRYPRGPAQSSLIPNRVSGGGGAVVTPKLVRVLTDSRHFCPLRDDPLLPHCPQFQYRLCEQSQYKPLVFKVGRKPGVERDPNHPTKKVALEGPYRNFVQAAIDREVSQYTETFPAIHLFSEKEMAALRAAKYDFRMALTSHMDITYKRDPLTNAFLDAKARLCVHGNEDQKYDFSDIKSPTVRAATVKLLLSLLAKVLPNGKTFTARTYDAKGAFLQNSIEDRNAMKAVRAANFEPEDPIVIRMPDGRYGLLLAYVYGLRQASREFQLQNDELLRAANYLPLPDPCMYMKTVGEDVIYVAVHVDDFWVQATSDELLEEFDAVLTARYGTLKRGTGNKLTYLGMIIEITSEGHVDVSGPGAAAELLNKFRSDKPPVDDYPMLASMVEVSGDAEKVDATKYRAVIGGINYYQQVYRPEMAYLASVAASAMQSATVRDWRMVERGLRYIEGTQGLKMRFHRDSDLRMYGWADASFQTRAKLRSQTGYSFSLGAFNAMFYSKSQQQGPMAQSSTEAEYIALYQCVCEAVWLRELVKAMLLDGSPVIVYQDNTSTIQWAAGSDNFHRTKHIARKYHFSREAWIDGIIEIRFCPTEEMVADILTKPLIGEQFAKHRTRLLGLW